MRAGTKILSSSTSGVNEAMNSSRVAHFVATLQICRRASAAPDFGAEPPDADELGAEGSEDAIGTRPVIIGSFPLYVQRKGRPPRLPVWPRAPPSRPGAVQTPRKT